MKLATVLLLDTSGSMADKDKINQLNKGVKAFKDQVLKDELARKGVDLAVVTFGDSVDVIHKFSSIEKFEPTTLVANGLTPMGKAILDAIDLVEQRSTEYRTQDIPYNKPWIIMITDGEPTDMQPGDSIWNEVTKKVHEGENKKFRFFAVGVEPANMDILRQIAPPNRVPMKLKESMFKEMFLWLSTSVEKVISIKHDEAEWGVVEWGEVPIKELKHPIERKCKVEYYNPMEVNQERPLKIGLLKSKFEEILREGCEVKWGDVKFKAEEEEPDVEIVPKSTFFKFSPEGRILRIKANEDVYTDFMIRPLMLPDTCRARIEIEFQYKHEKFGIVDIDMKIQDKFKIIDDIKISHEDWGGVLAIGGGLTTMGIFLHVSSLIYESLEYASHLVFLLIAFSLIAFCLGIYLGKNRSRKVSEIVG